MRKTILMTEHKSIVMWWEKSSQAAERFPRGFRSMATLGSFAAKMCVNLCDTLGEPLEHALQLPQPPSETEKSDVPSKAEIDFHATDFRFALDIAFTVDDVLPPE
jgi:hypothetical protein